MCRVGVFNEGRCPSIAIGLQNECKSVFNMACTMPWCHRVVHFEVDMSHFTAVFEDESLHLGSASAKQAMFLPR